MGRVIPFSQTSSYLQELEVDGSLKGAILDTNVLISATYETRDSHDSVVGILDELGERGYRLFATVSTRSEYLEYHRRLVLTERLFDLVDEYSVVKIPRRARARIQTLKGSLRTSIRLESDKDEVFNDSQLKKIKKEFSAGPHSGQESWLKICDMYLREVVQSADRDLFERGVEYVSPNEVSQHDLFRSGVTWTEAIRICERTGTAFGDSMILNALKSSKLPFIVTLDFDIGYAALSDPHMKDVIVPDRLSQEYRRFHFPN